MPGSGAGRTPPLWWTVGFRVQSDGPAACVSSVGPSALAGCPVASAHPDQHSWGTQRSRREPGMTREWSSSVVREARTPVAMTEGGAGLDVRTHDRPEMGDSELLRSTCVGDPYRVQLHKPHSDSGPHTPPWLNRTTCLHHLGLPNDHAAHQHIQKLLWVPNARCQ